MAEVPLTTRLRATGKRALNRIGLDLRLTRNVAAAEARRKLEEWRRPWYGLRQLSPVRTVIDVGANEGQFATMIHGVFPDARVFSFEPLAASYARLSAVLAGLPQARGYQLALGSRNDTCRMRRTSFTPCSSMLRPSARLKQEVVGLDDSAEEEVRVARLDDVLEPGDLEGPLLLKLDVQGFEREVLAGAPQVARAASLVVLEVAFVPLYEGQPQFDELYEVMRALGFTYRGNLEQNVSRLDGLITEADALFVR